MIYISNIVGQLREKKIHAQIGATVGKFVKFSIGFALSKSFVSFPYLSVVFLRRVLKVNID